MSRDILNIEGNYHLADNFGVYQTATYIGLKLALQLKQTWINPDTENVAVVFHIAGNSPRAKEEQCKTIIKSALWETLKSGGEGQGGQTLQKGGTVH